MTVVLSAARPIELIHFLGSTSYGLKCRRAGLIVNHPAAHRDRVLQRFMRDADLFERMNAPRRNRQIDRSSADDVSFAWISTPFVKIDIVPAPAQIRGEQTTRQTAADKNKLCVGHLMMPLLRFNICTANAQLRKVSRAGSSTSNIESKKAQKILAWDSGEMRHHCRHYNDFAANLCAELSRRR